VKALAFKLNRFFYILTGALDRRWPQVLFSPIAPVKLREVPAPRLLGDEWVTIRPRLAGLCGSDMGIILCHESLTLQPFASYPFVLGHEVCGDIVEKGAAVEGFEPGDRVTVMPMLGCRTRGIQPLCSACAGGRPQLCENWTEGSIAPGTIVGATAGIPGFLSEMGMAHVSQLHKVPDGVSDEAACMTDPLSNGLHMALQNDVRPGETLLIFGCGVLGLCTIAALRAVHPEARLLAVEGNPFNAGVARDMGVEEVLSPPFDKKFYARVAELTGSKMFKPMLSKPILSCGGVDRVFDTVGSTDTIQAGLRVLRGGGSFNLIGIGEPKKIDWTPVWFREITVRGMYGYQDEEYAGAVEHDFDLALRLHAEGRIDVGPLVTHKFSLDDWREGLEVALNKGASKAIKITFHP